MKLFRFSRVVPVLLALFLVSAATEVFAQGKGRGSQRGGGNHAERGSRGVDRAQGRQVQVQQVNRQTMQHAQQQRQQQAHQQVQQNRGIDRRNEMQQRMQQIQQQRIQQAQQQRGQQAQRQRERNGGVDRRAQMQQRMQQVQQQRMQQAQQQRGRQNQGIDYRAQMHQRMQQAQQRGQQNRGLDRRAQRMQLMQERMQHTGDRQQGKRSRGMDRRANMRQRIEQVQPQRVQMAQKRAGQERGLDRRIQRQQSIRPNGQVSGWAGDERLFGRQRRNRFNAGLPQIVPRQKVRNPYQSSQNGSRDYRQDRRGRDRNIFIQRQSVVLESGSPRNYGHERRAQVRQRNAERRAWRDRNAWAYSTPDLIWQNRTYVSNYRPRTFYDSYVYNPWYQSASSYEGWSGYTSGNSDQLYGGNDYPDSYADPYYEYSGYDRPSAGDIFRNVIFAVLGGVTSSYDDAGDYDPSYTSDHYWASTPYYASYDGGGYPAGYSFATDPYYYDPNFYDDPYYAEVLPIQYFSGNQPAGGLFRQLFTHLLALGYDQGYQDGIAAREIAENDRVFYDPYAYDNVAYDPYSVSLGDNRRCLSQGYELGYEDGINGINGYDQFQDGGVDLVSVLIGTVSQLI